MYDYPSLSTPLLALVNLMDQPCDFRADYDFNPSFFNVGIEQPELPRMTDKTQDWFPFPTNPGDEIDPQQLSNTSVQYRLEPPSASIQSGSTRESDDEEHFDIKDWMIQDTVSHKSRAPKLFEYLRLLLDNTRYVSYASWLNKKEGLFKIHEPIRVAKLWRQIKIRRKAGSTDYDTFARSIRSYYKSGIMRKTRTRHTCRFAKV